MDFLEPGEMLLAGAGDATLSDEGLTEYNSRVRAPGKWKSSTRVQGADKEWRLTSSMRSVRFCLVVVNEAHEFRNPLLRPFLKSSSGRGLGSVEGWWDPGVHLALGLLTP